MGRLLLSRGTPGVFTPQDLPFKSFILSLPAAVRMATADFWFAPKWSHALPFLEPSPQSFKFSFTLQAVAPPGPIQLVDGAVAMLSKSPATAFALSDLLSATCRQDGGKNCAPVLQRLVEILRRPGVWLSNPQSLPLDVAIQAPAHLLAVLTAENPTLAAEAYAQGMLLPLIASIDLFGGFFLGGHLKCAPLARGFCAKARFQYLQLLQHFSMNFIELEIFQFLSMQPLYNLGLQFSKVCS